jgi:hypothetical protein
VEHPYDGEDSRSYSVLGGRLLSILARVWEIPAMVVVAVQGAPLESQHLSHSAAYSVDYSGPTSVLHVTMNSGVDGDG